MNDWYRVNNVHDTAHVFIGDDIGFDGPSAADLILDLDRAPKVELRINSFGGCSKTAVAIYNDLRRRETTCVIDGRAWSSAAVIAMAARRIEIFDGSTIMLHGPQGAVEGSAEEMYIAAEVLEGFTLPLIDIFAERTGKPVAIIKRWLAADSYFTAHEAVANGLADAVIPRREPILKSFAPPARRSTEAAVAPMHETELFALDMLRALGPVNTSNRGRLAREITGWMAAYVREI